MSRAWIVSMCLLAGCAPPAAPICGEGTDPVILTGLVGRHVSGDVDMPVVEVQLVVPETCEPLGESWLFWDEAADTVVLGEEPTEGDLLSGGVETDDDLIFFRQLNLGVRLAYPEEGVISDELTLTWFSEGTDLAVVSCAAEGESLACALAP